MVGMAVFGCGLKGPPVPRAQPPLPSVVDLSFQVADQSVTLTWRLPGPLSGRIAKNAAFGIFRSRTVLEPSACDDCPLVFEKVASVPYVFTENHRYFADTPLAPGYRYRFKVRLETDGHDGSDSNLVQFDHLATGG